jgi:hypothetical protein
MRMVVALDETELLACAVQTMEVVVRVSASQDGGELTLQPVKSCGLAVTITVPDAPEAGTLAEVDPRDTDPEAPD